MRYTFGPISYILVGMLLCVLASCETTDGEFHISIMPSGEQLGLTEPCGCSRPQIGGISRRAALINELRQSGRRVLLVDNGDLVTRPGPQPNIKFETFLRAMKQMRYAALNIGERELYLDIDTLTEQSEMVQIPFVSANLFINSKRPFQPYTLAQLPDVNGGSFTVGIVGVLSPALVDELRLGIDGLDVRDPVAVLTGLLPDVKEKCDFILLLAHTTLGEAKELAESFPQIAVVVSGHDIDPPPDEYIRVGDSVVVNPGMKGKYQVRLDAAMGMDGSVSWTSWLVTPLEETLSASKEIEEILNQYQETLRDYDLLRSYPKVEHPRGVYVGAQACTQCHQDSFEVCQASKHAGAHKTLVNAQRQYDPECIVCHVDGFDYVTGFISLDETPELAGVGCEDCHGPGGNHVEDQTVSMKTAGEEGCRGCHTGDQSPHFKFDTYWPQVKH